MKISRRTDDKAIAILGVLSIILVVVVVVLAVVLPHSNPDDIISYPVDSNEMAIENTHDRGMVEVPAEVYVVTATQLE